MRVVSAGDEGDMVVASAGDEGGVAVAAETVVFNLGAAASQSPYGSKERGATSRDAASETSSVGRVTVSSNKLCTGSIALDHKEAQVLGVLGGESKKNTHSWY